MKRNRDDNPRTVKALSNENSGPKGSRQAACSGRFVVVGFRANKIKGTRGKGN